uniref:C2H2-type domain-containing protein n=1 Tax=Mola mola TaxID=94237 RepID=A0A3Q4BWS4_MOLML
MSSVQLLRVVVSQRLSAAAEDILEAVKKTLAGYEEEILLSKREIRRQRRVLQTLLQPESQLALSVWEEDSLGEQEWSSSQDQELTQTEKSQEEFIFTPPYVKNEFDQLQSAEGDRDPLPGTSAEQEQVRAKANDRASSSSPVSEHHDSDEEWRGSAGSESEDSDDSGMSKKMKGPRLPMVPKLHQTKKGKSQISCKVCGKAFHANISLVNHMEVHAKDVCGVCGERFDAEDSFQAHLKTHVRAEICNFCGKCFGSSNNLETHMRIHTGEKPFNCGECGKSFNCRHNMIRHIRIHTGEKPYSCTVCGKCFSDYSTLKRHLLVHLDIIVILESCLCPCDE